MRDEQIVKGTKMTKQIITLRQVIGTGIVIFILVYASLYILKAGVGTSVAEAAPKNKWEKVVSGTIVDVDPIALPDNVGLFFEISYGQGGGKWIWILSKDISGPWATRGEYGTFYKKGDKYKWEKLTSGKPKTLSSVPSKKVVTTTEGWTSMVMPPPIEHTVLVRYKNGRTITTAYLNSKKQWKLETDRERISGGREIVTIKEWKEIPR